MCLANRRPRRYAMGNDRGLAHFPSDPIGDKSMSQSTMTWVAVGDSSGARIFKFDKQADPWTLVEAIKGDGSGADTGTRDFGKKASEHKGALHGHGDIEKS